MVKTKNQRNKEHYEKYKEKIIQKRKERYEKNKEKELKRKKEIYQEKRKNMLPKENKWMKFKKEFSEKNPEIKNQVELIKLASIEYHKSKGINSLTNPTNNINIIKEDNMQDKKVFPEAFSQKGSDKIIALINHGKLNIEINKQEGIVINSTISYNPTLQEIEVLMQGLSELRKEKMFEIKEQQMEDRLGSMQPQIGTPPIKQEKYHYDANYPDWRFNFKTNKWEKIKKWYQRFDFWFLVALVIVATLYLLRNIEPIKGVFT